MGTSGGLFSYEQGETKISKGPNRWSTQRAADGTPHTRGGASALVPPSADPKLVLDGMNKSYYEAEACIDGVTRPGIAEDMYQYLSNFKFDSKVKKKAIKLLEEELKLEHRQNKGKFKKNPEEYWNKLQSLNIRKKELILEEVRTSMSKGLKPANVVNMYLENGPAIAKAYKEKEKSLNADDCDDDSKADDIKKTD